MPRRWSWAFLDSKAKKEEGREGWISRPNTCELSERKKEKELVLDRVGLGAKYVSLEGEFRAP